MTARGGAVLYTPEILSLAVELARYPLDETLPFRGEAQSRVCGSKVNLTLSVDADDRIAAVSARVSACAIGQAAAALFLDAAAGHDGREIAEAKTGIENWLAGSEALPEWPGISRLASARAFPARHAAILLPWNAALAALSNRAAAD